MTFKKIAILSASVLALSTFAVSVTESPSTHVVYAAKSKLKTRIAVPKGYTTNLIEDWCDNPSNTHVTHKLQRLSRQGMINNRFYDQTINDNRKVDLNNLSSSDQYELSQYALTLINSIRTQLGLPKFVYTASAQGFANDIAKAYNEDNWSDYESHNISAINNIAKMHGLTHAGDNEYEDLAGFDMTTGHQYATIYQVKQGIYYNIKQFAFGGFRYHNWKESDKQNLNYYTEWYHAYDLFTGDYSQEFALSLSYLIQDPTNKVNKITSSHYIHVDPENIEKKALYEK